jgi:hypothetical protein
MAKAEMKRALQYFMQANLLRALQGACHDGDMPLRAEQLRQEFPREGSSPRARAQGPEPRGRMDERHLHIYIQAMFPKEILVLNNHHLSGWFGHCQGQGRG